MNKVFVLGIILVSMLTVAAKMLPTTNDVSHKTTVKLVADSNELPYRDDADYSNLNRSNLIIARSS